MAEHSDAPSFVFNNPNSNYGSEIHSSAKVKVKRVVARLGGPDRAANAALIIRAVNSHDALVLALKEVRALAQFELEHPTEMRDVAFSKLQKLADQALALCEQDGGGRG